MKENPEPPSEVVFFSFVSEQLNGFAHNGVPFPQGSITSSAWEGWWHEETRNHDPLGAAEPRTRWRQ